MDINSTEKDIAKVMDQFNKHTGGNMSTVTDEQKVIQFLNHKLDPSHIWNEAKSEAVTAVEKYMEGKEEPMYCGFANVSIYPARGKFVSWLKKQGIGDTGYQGGYRISYYDIMPRDHRYSRTQSLDVREVACDMFAKILKKYGLTAYSESRAD